MSPTSTPTSTTPNPYLEPSLACNGEALPTVLAVGVGPVFPITVVSVIVCGVVVVSTAEQVLPEGQVDGLVVPARVVSWLVIVIKEVEAEVVVELGYTVDMLADDVGEGLDVAEPVKMEEVEVEDIVTGGGDETDVAQGI